ncbi:hypothetical protein CVT06_07270 [Campylobacter concisus]|uniref:Uncharacterized protein n=1 Tax=Campylobacter concisus TaxID=199 RepID=A0A7S9NFM6_9BACT|nr:hypothetical protein [Campylobacter concisus]QPH84889.1 hypothetical protein CVT06_07270 [Campylobacter concisus]
MKLLRMRTAFILNDILCIFSSFAKNFYTNATKKKFLLFIDKIEYTIKFYIDLLISALFQMVQNNSLANSTDMSKRLLFACYKIFKHNKSFTA